MYETQKRKVLDRDILVSVVMTKAPEDVKSALRQEAHRLGDDFDALQAYLHTFLATGRQYNVAGVPIASGGPEPMQVGCLGKGEGKDSDNDKGKGYHDQFRG